MRPLLLLLVLLVAGCAAPADPAPDRPDTADTDTDASTSLPWEGVVTGTVEDAAGDALGGLDVTLCSGICQVTTADASGAWRFEHVWPGTQVLETLTYPGEVQADAVLAWSRCFDLVPLGEDETLHLDRPCRVHPVETVGPLTGSQDLLLADGLRVAFDADRVVEEGRVPMPAPHVALGATELPQADHPAGVPAEWRVLRAWTLAVWDLELEDGFAVVAELPEPLPPGTDVAFLVADYLHGFQTGEWFVEEAELAPDGASIATPEGAGLDRTTLWMAVARSAR